MGEVDWINLAKDRDQWQPLVNLPLNPSVLCFTCHLGMSRGMC
jgi:hypothetical protein